MIAANENDFLLPKEVAALLHVSPKTVARWATQQKLPYVKTLGGHRRFPADQIGALGRRLAGEGGTQGGAVGTGPGWWAPGVEGSVRGTSRGERRTERGGPR